MLDVLELLAAAGGPLPTMAIAGRCAIPKSSAHHLLNVLRARRFVTYHEHERAWGLGVAAFETGAAYLRSTPLQRLGRPLLEELTRATGETAHLATLDGPDVLYVDKQQPVGFAATLVTEVGVRLPAHLTAVGRAMLARLEPDEVRARWPGGSLARRTDRGPADVDALLAELARVRRRGHALDEGMVTPGISCVAAPVLGHDGGPAGAIGVTFVSAQRDGAAVAAVTELVVEAAGRLSAGLGHREGPR